MLNRVGVEGQIEGGTAQGVGLALMEEIQVREGRIANASFTDYLDSDGIEVNEVKFVVDLTVDGNHLTADFSRSDPMVRGSLNCTPSFAEAAVYHTIMAACEGDIPCTGGATRPVTVVPTEMVRRLWNDRQPFVRRKRDRRLLSQGGQRRS